MSKTQTNIILISEFYICGFFGLGEFFYLHFIDCCLASGSTYNSTWWHDPKIIFLKMFRKVNAKSEKSILLLPHKFCGMIFVANFLIPRSCSTKLLTISSLIPSSSAISKLTGRQIAQVPLFSRHFRPFTLLLRHLAFHSCSHILCLLWNICAKY